jgi:hypothetical protein
MMLLDPTRLQTDYVQLYVRYSALDVQVLTVQIDGLMDRIIGTRTERRDENLMSITRSSDLKMNLSRRRGEVSSVLQETFAFNVIVDNARLRLSLVCGGGIAYI